MNEEAIIREHGDYVRAYARKLGWYLPGADLEDLEQEALFGLLRACRSYKPERGAFWPHFALECVHRWLVWVLRRSLAGKHRPLNTAYRRAWNEIDEEVDICEFIPDHRAGVPELVEAREQLRAILEAAPELSELERRAVFGFVAGYSYAELEGVGRSVDVKRIDNAMQRGRDKLRRAA